MTMTFGLPALCALCWFIGILYGLFLAERRGRNRSLMEIVAEKVGGEYE